MGCSFQGSDYAAQCFMIIWIDDVAEPAFGVDGGLEEKGWLCHVVLCIVLVVRMEGR